MDSSSIDNHSKASGFNKFKCLLYYPRFSKISRVEDLNQFLVVFYDCVSSF